MLIEEVSDLIRNVLKAWMGLAAECWMPLRCGSVVLSSVWRTLHLFSIHQKYNRQRVQPTLVIEFGIEPRA